MISLPLLCAREAPVGVAVSIYAVYFHLSFHFVGKVLMALVNLVYLNIITVIV